MLLCLGCRKNHSPRTTCQVCGKQLGYIAGIRGFGFREARHTARCVAQAKQVSRELSSTPSTIEWTIEDEMSFQSETTFLSKPSVGTWLMQPPQLSSHANAHESNSEAGGSSGELADGPSFKSETPFFLKPSVGTWLMQPPQLSSHANAHESNSEAGISSGELADGPSFTSETPFFLTPSLSTWLMQPPQLSLLLARSNHAAALARPL
jgi:hypothetical protein